MQKHHYSQSVSTIRFQSITLYLLCRLASCNSFTQRADFLFLAYNINIKNVNTPLIIHHAPIHCMRLCPVQEGLNPHRCVSFRLIEMAENESHSHYTRSNGCYEYRNFHRWLYIAKAAEILNKALFSFLGRKDVIIFHPWSSNLFFSAQRGV